MLGVHHIGQLTVGPVKGPAPAVLIKPETMAPQGGGGSGYPDGSGTPMPPDYPSAAYCEESIIRKADCSLKPIPIVGGLVAAGIIAGLLLRQG
jgi:hypothetical protein